MNNFKQALIIIYYSVSVGKVFDEIGLMQDYVKIKLPTWSANKIQSESRWLDVFAYMKEQQRPLIHLSMLVEFAFALPGSSTDVERLFSIINDVWAPDKGQMSLEMLEAVLNVKINKRMSCVDFYQSIKDDKIFLIKAQGSDKYKEGQN